MVGEFKDRTVCFLDLLGFSEAIVSAARDKREISKISNLISKSKNEMQERFNETDLTFQNLSDSIFVATPSNNVDHVQDLFRAIQELTIFFLKNGFALRGGVASGLCLISPEIILGEPVVRAVKIESNLAEVPRVALSKSTISLIKGNESFDPTILKRSSDGIYWVDPFGSIFGSLQRNHEKWVKCKDDGDLRRAKNFRAHVDRSINDANRIVEVVQKNINDVTENKNVFSKYYWLARQIDEASLGARNQVGKELRLINLSL